MLTKLPKLQEKGWANLNSEEKFYFATNVSFAFFLGLIFIAPNSSFVGGLCCLTLIASFVSTQVLGNVANPETIVGLNQFNEFADNAGTNMISEIDAGNNMDPQDRMVSSAMKKLETMLIDRGYTASSLLENFDTDGDGEGDNSDSDDDGDGYSDTNEDACGSDSRDAASTPSDFDGDEICDVLDDDDNDGPLAQTEAGEKPSLFRQLPGFPALFATIALVGAALIGRRKDD